MTFERPPREKSEYLPSVRVEPKRKADYVKAWEAWKREQGPHVLNSFGEFVRAAVDEYAARYSGGRATRG